MTGRVVLAGVLGGVAMYVWASVAHMSPLGMIGFKELPNEATAVAALQTAVREAGGLYIFPSQGGAADKAAYAEKLKTTPQGVLVYKPAGTPMMTPGQLIVELVLELVEAVLAAWLLSQTALSAFWSRVRFVTAIGVVVAITTNGSYWNWYGYPVDYTLANIFMQVVGFFVAGLVIAFMTRNKETVAAA